MRTMHLAIILSLVSLPSVVVAADVPPPVAIEAIVVKVFNDGSSATLKIEKSSDESRYKKGAQLWAICPNLTRLLKVNDKIAGSLRLGGGCKRVDRLSNVTILKRRSPITFQAMKPGVTVLKPARLVVRSGEEWIDKLDRIVSPVAGPMWIPTVDWKKNMALLVSMGTQQSTGYSIRIMKVENCLHEIVVSVKTQSPKPGQAVGKAMTHPVHLVTIAQSDLPVRFVAEGDEDKPFAVPFKILAKKWQGGLAKPERIVISDAKRWAKTWKRMKRKAADLPKIDFREKTVIALFLGHLTQTGARSEIVRVVRTPDAVEVFVRKIGPGLADALSNPYFIGAIDTAGFPVQLIDIVEVRKQFLGRSEKIAATRNAVFKDKKNWEAHLKQIGLEGAAALKPDFEREMVIALNGARVDKTVAWWITKRENVIVAEATFATRENVKTLPSYAYAVIPKSDAKVKFVEKRTVMIAPPIKPLPYAVGRLIILFQAGVAHEEQLTLIKALGAEPSRRIKSINGYILTLPKDQIPAERAAIEKVMEAFRKKFQDHPKIKSAEFDMIMRLQPMPHPRRRER